MTLTCDRCGRQFRTWDEPVAGRVYRVPCRCGASLVFELGSTGRPPPARPALARWTPPPLPPAARAGLQLRAPAFGGAAAAGGSDLASTAATVPGPMAPGSLAAWADALPEPDGAADASVEPVVRADGQQLPGLDPDPEEGLEHSILTWLSAEVARDRAFATGFASGSGAAVLVVVAAVWLGTAAVRTPYAVGRPSLLEPPVARAASTPPAGAGPAQASPSLLANAIALAAPSRSTPQARASRSREPARAARGAGHRELALATSSADDAKPAVEAPGARAAEPAPEARSSDDAAPGAAHVEPAAAEEPGRSGEPPSTANAAQSPVAAPEAAAAEDPVAASAQGPDAEAGAASPGADSLAAKL